jgi:hypothetical protein
MTKNDLMDSLERLDAWLDGEDDGSRPQDLLRARGISFRRGEEVDDDAIGEELWRLIAALAEIGYFIELTDHLSDRELYAMLFEQIAQPTFLAPDDLSFAAHWSPIGGYSEEDLEIHYTYYADDEDRERASKLWPDTPLPPRKPLPHDRDRLLPKSTERQMMAFEPQG